MPIIDIQKRARELGRIRIGRQVPTQRGGTRPEKLDRFRLTSASQPLLEKVAELYGGTVEPWTPKGGSPQWEVVTDSKRIPIFVPPQPVSQWLETWSAAGCIHRCDGVTNALTGDPCDPDDQAHKEARPTTRLNVVLRDVEGMGVWRLESHGWNAAIELPNAAEFLSQAGGYIDGHLALEERTSKGTNERTGKPETRKYMVPIIEINVTPAELMAGRGAVGAPQVEGPVTAPAIGAAAPALEAQRPDYLAIAQKATDLEAVRFVWNRAADAGHLDDELKQALTDLGNSFVQQGEPPEDVDAEVVLDPPDVLWQRCITVAGGLGWDLDGVERALKDRQGVSPFDATAEQLDAFLTSLEQDAA